MRFYGRLADTVAREIEMDMPEGCSVADLREALAARYPQAEIILQSSRSRACVGDSLVGDDQLIANGETVEFMPPVSGG